MVGSAGLRSVRDRYPIGTGPTDPGGTPWPAWDDGGVSMPQYPRPEQFGAGRRSEYPGLIPLRPLGVGEILAAAVLLVRRHLLPLGAVAVLVSGLSTAVTLGVLAGTGSLSSYADSTWLNDLLAGTSTSIPGSILLAAGLGTLVSTIGAPIVAGLASAYAGAEALGRNASGAVTERLAGRWPVLLGVAASVGVLVSLGLAVFLVPGVIAYLVLALAAPVAVMERSGVQASLRRSAQLTHGHRGRILGAVALAMIIGFFLDVLASTLATAVFGAVDAVTLLVITQSVSVLVAGLTGSFTGAVVAVLYIDVRIRSEGLADSLRMAAAADRLRVDPTVHRGIPGVNPGGLNPPERPGP